MSRLHLTFVLLLSVLAGCSTETSGERPPPASDEPMLTLDAERVPADLRHLVPLAERWGIGDDVDRLAKVDGSTAAQRAALREALAPHHDRITEWLNSFPEGQMSDEAAAFMYMQVAEMELPDAEPE